MRTQTEQNVTVGEPESEGSRSRPRTIRAAIPHVSLLEEASASGSPAGRRKDMCGILACRAWIPLTYREAGTDDA